MNDIARNKATWEGFDWTGDGRNGDRWSGSWGNPLAQWRWSLFPRIAQHLPAKSLCEIAPGYGRWTAFLLDQCESYIGIDLSQTCVDHCKATFSTASHASFALNDGLSLDDVPDDSVDFLFSFDSLVHCNFEIISAYIPQVLRKLKANGVAFIHHSNLLDQPEALKDNRHKIHWRAPDVSAERVRQLIERNDAGQVLTQEIVNWGSVYFLDCFTTFSARSNGIREPHIVRNNRFMEEADIIRSLQPLYAPSYQSS